MQLPPDIPTVFRPQNKIKTMAVKKKTFTNRLRKTETIRSGFWGFLFEPERIKHSQTLERSVLTLHPPGWGLWNIPNVLSVAVIVELDVIEL